MVQPSQEDRTPSGHACGGVAGGDSGARWGQGCTTGKGQEGELPHPSAIIRVHGEPRPEVSTVDKGGEDGLGYLLLGPGCWTKGKVPEEIYSAALLRVDHPSGGRVCKSPGLLIGLSA